MYHSIYLKNWDKKAFWKIFAQEKYYAYDSFPFDMSKTLQTSELTFLETTILTMLQFVIFLNACPCSTNAFMLKFFQ